MKHSIIVLAFLVLLLQSCSSGVQQTEKPLSLPDTGNKPVPSGAFAEAETTGINAPPVSRPGRSRANELPVAENIEKPAKESIKEDVRKEIEKLREELGEGYLAGVEGPFIVLGNIPEAKFKQIMRYTIRACSDRMYKQYFRKKPEYMLKIYLFGDDTSYRETAKKLWNDTDLSHFGYFKPSEKSLVMNISTGTGTLVHEMFHALVEPDFPEIPSWFNEGVASLYECCRVGEDGLYGMINWRFPRLKEAIEKDELVPLKRLVFTSTGQFYGRGSDLHYAEARYFCMYLQEKNYLTKFYNRFRDNCETDPTGKTFLEELFEKKIEEIEKDWIKWVKTLRYNN